MFMQNLHLVLLMYFVSFEGVEELFLEFEEVFTYISTEVFRVYSDFFNGFVKGLERS